MLALANAALLLNVLFDMTEPSVLVVDDDEDNVEILEAALVPYGFICTKARSSADAKELLTNQPFDALVSDFSLGDGDAIGLLEALGEGRPKVAILVTGYGSNEDRERSRAAGFDAHLVKPIDLAQLVGVLRGGLKP